MKIFRWSDPISLPLAPTIAGTIADYLQLLAQQVYVLSPRNHDNFATESAPDGSWYWQYRSSIRLVTTSPYQYVSTIAHRLAAKSSFTPLEICQNFQPSSRFVATPADTSLDLDCWYNEAGYFYFQVTAASIGKWLSYIHDLPLVELDLDPSGSSLSIAAYAHARCCSVLKLAAAEHIVAITASWQVAPQLPTNRSPQHSARLGSENPFRAESNCLFEHPAEARLIQVLMRVLDSISAHNWGADINRQFGGSTSKKIDSAKVMRRDATENISSPNWSKLTIDLAHSWLDFYRYCQIFGDVKSQNPRLAIARCGLTAISRRYLQVLLENYLGIAAAIEL